MKIIILKGLPASGKSTYAKQLVKTKQYKRINKDDLRMMLDNGTWSPKQEEFIVKVRNAIFYEALNDGYNIVIDDTNLHPKHEQNITQMVSEWSKKSGKVVDIETKFFEISVDEAIKRDLDRTRSVGEKVIKDMYRQFLKPKVTYIPPENKPKTILCDLDGTLAHMVNRKPFDWHKVGDDLLDVEVKEILDKYSNTHQVILLSGRDGVCKNDTLKWLSKHSVHYDILIMRKEGDKRKDTIVKKELFNNEIRDNYQVDFVIDDRPSVCRMWRDEVGLKVLQVGDPELEF